MARVFTRRMTGVRLSAADAAGHRVFLPGEVVRLTPDRTPDPQGDAPASGHCVFEADGWKYIAPSDEFFEATQPVEEPQAE